MNTHIYIYHSPHLQVPVDDPHPVQVLEGQHQLGGQEAHHGHRERAQALDVEEELLFSFFGFRVRESYMCVCIYGVCIYGVCIYTNINRSNAPRPGRSL